MIHYWLIKSEPHTYSIDQLQIDGTTSWTGVRNYQARNYMRDTMKIGDLCFFYHSNAKPEDTGIVGLAAVTSLSYPDATATDPTSPYAELRPHVSWVAIDITFKQKFARIGTLHELKRDPHLSTMVLVQKGSRLSIQPVSNEHATYLLSLLG
jgi:predicted RNA-binding protein with PUA-like domain